MIDEEGKKLLEKIRSENPIKLILEEKRDEG